MNTSSIQTLTFLFDNKTDHILLLQVADDGPVKRNHTGIKGTVGLTEDLNQASIRSVQEACGLEVSSVVLRGVLKTIGTEPEASTIYFIYESSKFTGEMGNLRTGRMKWVDILNIFNLQMESIVQEIMPNLLDGESFFEGTVRINELDEVLSSEIRICNAI